MTVNKRISDVELVERLHNGDVEAFDQIFERYGSRLFGFALKYLKSKEETEGIVQDVFLKIWENRKILKKESSFKSYLFTIAYHDICKLFRRKQIQLKLSDEILKTANPKLNLEDEVDYNFTLEQVNKLIEKLPEKQRIIFEKSRKEGKTTKEIAKEMNLAPGTVDNQISATLKFLRKNLSVHNFALLLFFAFFIQ